MPIPRPLANMLTLGGGGAALGAALGGGGAALSGEDIGTGALEGAGVGGLAGAGLGLGAGLTANRMDSALGGLKAVTRTRGGLEQLLARLAEVEAGYQPPAAARPMTMAQLPRDLEGLADLAASNAATFHGYPQEVLDAITPPLLPGGKGVNPAWLEPARSVGTVGADREAVMKILMDTGLGIPDPSDPARALLSQGVTKPSAVPALGVYGGRLGAVRVPGMGNVQPNVLTGEPQAMPSLASELFSSMPEDMAQRELQRVIASTPAARGNVPGISRPMHASMVPFPQGQKLAGRALGEAMTAQAAASQAAQYGPLERMLYALSTGTAYPQP